MILDRYTRIFRIAVSLAGAMLVSPGWAADGATVYSEYCLVCHGEKGDGDTRVRRGLSSPPRDFTTVQAHRELSRERMINSVTHGRPGTAMMPFDKRLSEDEVAAVVDYIRSKFMTGKGRDRPAKMVRGEQLYVRNCAVCHGDRGSGAVWTQSSLNPPPRNFTAALRDELTRERMIISVTYGRPGTAMMSFRKRLSPEEIETVVDYIRASFLGKDVKPSAEQTPLVQADMSLPFPKGLRGDPEKGKEFFNNNCFTCHGKQGDGKGPRSKFLDPPPRNFLTPDSRSRLNRPALFVAVREGVVGSVMPSWGKVLNDQEIANVAEYVFEAFVHPQSAQADSAPLPGADKKKLNTP